MDKLEQKATVNSKDNKKKVVKTLVAVIGVLAVAAIGVACYLVFFKDKTISIKDSDVEAVLTTDYLKETYDKAKKGMEDIKNDPERVQNYFIAGMEWKTLGDLTNKETFYKKSLEIYERAVAKTGGKNTIALINAASVNILLKNFSAAEKYLKDAIVVSPGDIDLYTRLLELYKYYIKKDVATIAQVYDDAMKRVLDPWSLLRDRAAYYYELGKFEESLADYERLKEKFPDVSVFKDRVEELRLRMGK